MEYYTWNQNIMLFTVANIYLQIANDNYGLIQFKGQLKDWYLNQLCYPEIVEIKFICHYTCKTCKGFSIQDCISCRGEHYRVFSESQNTCKCKLGYIDVPNQAQCQELNQYHKAFELQEKQIAIKKKSYYQIGSYNIICELGYFQYKNKCIEWQIIQYMLVHILLKMIYPNIFSQTLYCTFQFISKDDESVLIYKKLSENEQEIYTISDIIIENEYKIILIEGQGNLECKNGYFKKNNICTQCSENCETCKNEDQCHTCSTQYNLNSENKCVECITCAKLNTLVTDFGPLVYYECGIGTYEYNQLCLPCGSYCSLCTQDSCFTCVDPEKYFITLDSINCISCLIENCKYCFQYYVDQNQNIVNSIDFGNKQIIKDYEIETACALCQINYFYSFLTQKCEFQPYDMTDCQSGIIQIDGTNKCIISNTRTDAVLQSICINIFCKSCILNYSSDIYSFCMRCYDGFYSSFYDGQCFKCPAFCLTCVEKEQYQNNQKLSIRPFYQYFINNKNDHLFENYQFKLLEVVCLTCYPYYSLINDRCKQSCSKDCINCDIVNDVNDFRGVLKDLLCSKCKPDAFNFQRSVYQRSQCLQCPEQCSACVSRSSDQITELNPFFDQNSSFLKYTFICFLTDHNNQVKIKPQYYVPNKCSNSQYCDNKIQISQLVYCNRNAFDQAKQSKINKQTFQLFYDIIYNRALNKLETSEMLEYMNQHQITEINYNLELIDFQDFDMCYISADGFSIQNTWKKYVFSLKQINILFYKSQKNKDEKLPLQLSTLNFSFINFNQIKFQGISFRNYDKQNKYFYQQRPFAVINFINDYDPVTILFKDCEIRQTYWDKSTILIITSNRPNKLIMEYMSFFNLLIYNSKIFNLQPPSYDSNNTQQIAFFIINNSTFTNTSIFFYNANNFTLKNVINFTNITIRNSNFYSSFFINTTLLFHYNVGEFYFENFHLENLTFQNKSVCFNIINAIKLEVRNLSIIKVKFLDKSSFLISNILNIQGLEVLNSFINSGYIINILSKTELNRINVLTNNYIFSHITFINNTYSEGNSFIRLIQNELTKNRFFCSDVILENNVYAETIIGKLSFNKYSYTQSLIYLDCEYCSLVNLTIERGIGLPEISIINSQYLFIQQLKIQSQHQYITKLLHPSFECLKKFAYLDTPFVLYIFNYQNIELDNILVQNTYIISSQLFYIYGKTSVEQFFQEQIKINNVVFKNNILLNANENKQSTLLYIESFQKITINLTNIKFLHNFLNQHYTSSVERSSTTLLILAKLGDVNLKQSLFLENSITNSSDSIMYIQAKSIVMDFCNFSQQNILNTNFFKKNILVINNYLIEDQDVFNKFQIYSEGGNGHLYSSIISIKNTFFQNSLAINGGGLYITTSEKGIVFFINCSIFQTSTILNINQLAFGGFLYIDSSRSILNLTISNCKIQQTYSRTQGGAIYIEPSKYFNFIRMDNLIIESVFSIQHSFLSYSPSKQTSVLSEIIMKKLSFQNTESDFLNFATKISDLQEQNLILFQSDNPLMYIQFSNLTMEECKFDNIHLAFLIQIEQGIQINIEDLNIQNSSIFQSPFLKLSLKTDTQGYIKLKNIKINDLKHKNLTNSNSCTTYQIIYHDQLCPQLQTQISQEVEIQFNQLDQLNQLNCNLNQFYSIVQGTTFSLIEINNIKKIHKIYIQSLDLQFVACLKCQYGVLAIKQFDAAINLQIDNLKMLNNQCGVLGCLSIIKSEENINLVSSQQQILNQFKQGNSPLKYNIILSNSAFNSNTAKYGGACFLSEIDILVNNTIFLNNEAQIQGGAIYYIANQTNLVLFNNQIIQNKAEIGGGIYFQQQQLQKTNYLQLYIQDNEGNFAKNLYETPMYLYLSLDKNNTQQNIHIFQNSTMVVESIKINPHKIFFSHEYQDYLFLPTGIKFSDYNYFYPQNNTYTPFNQTFRLIVKNQFNEKISNLEGTQCEISCSIYNKSNNFSIENINFIQVKQSQCTSMQKVLFNMETGDYNLDDLVIFFNPYQNNELSLQLAFQCNSIKIPYFDKSLNQPTYIISNYILLLNVKTFPCQLGEFFNKTSEGCVLCGISQSQYSVTPNASFCSYKDETKIQAIKAASIQLRPQYWRAYYYSDIIEECHNLLANCEGGWFAGNPSCATGHIGALCEQCDLYNIRGLGFYSSNQSYQCSNCDQSAQNILNIIFVILWTLISVTITVTSTIKMIDDLIFQLKLRPLGFISVVESASTSVLLKVFTNYLQIVSSIASFQLSIPIGVTLAVRGVGNPIGSMAFSLNCYLKSISSIPMLYFSVIWGFVIAGMYIFLLFFFHILLGYIDKKQLNITFVTTTFIYVYIYLSPNLVSELSFLISYRNVSGQKWIASNVAYLYNTQEHKQWLFYFVTPTFFIIGILLPFFFWYIVYHHRFTLNSKKTRKTWGYLYNEYKQSVYYWETIKIIQKQLIILILIYYEDYVAIKACLIFFLLHLYSKLTTKFRPYLTENLNQIDFLSNSICKFSIVLAWAIYSAQILEAYEVIWPFYFILAFVNCFFIIEMVKKLIFAYFDKLYEDIDKAKTLIFINLPPNLKKNKICLRLLQNTTERKQIVRQRFKQLRIYLINQARLILNFKKQNNIDCQNTLTNLYIRSHFKPSKFETILTNQSKVLVTKTDI